MTPLSVKEEADMRIQSTLPTAVVSGHTGAGVQALWKEILQAASDVSVKDGVPVHLSARR